MLSEIKNKKSIDNWLKIHRILLDLNLCHYLTIQKMNRPFFLLWGQNPWI